MIGQRPGTFLRLGEKVRWWHVSAALVLIRDTTRIAASSARRVGSIACQGMAEVQHWALFSTGQ